MNETFAETLDRMFNEIPSDEECSLTEFKVNLVKQILEDALEIIPSSGKDNPLIGILIAIRRIIN